MTRPPVSRIGIVRKKAHWAYYVGLTLVALVFVLVAVIYFDGYPLVRSWVESPAGQAEASKGLGKALKVDGTFAPLRLQDWTIHTDSFTSTGWPGEALGGFNAKMIQVELDPWAVLHKAWRVKQVTMEEAEVQLVPPNDALKRPVPPKAEKPWYLEILPAPDHLECGPITSLSTELHYQFRDQSATIHDAHVQADLVGKDLKYTATSGILEMPYLPKLRVQRLVMLVTHPQVTVYAAEFAGLDPADPARVSLKGTIGMRANKAINASGEITELPIEQILPEDLKNLLQGRASGKLTWASDSSGKVIDSDGHFSFDGLQINNISVFKQLAALSGNEDLKVFPFQEATAEFHLHNNHVLLKIHAVSKDRFTLQGMVGYEISTKLGDVHMAFSDIPIKTWLPDEMKPDADGIVRANLDWQGHFNTVKESTGRLSVNLDSTRITTPALMKLILKKKRIHAPRFIDLKTGQFQLVYQDDAFQLSQCDIVSPGVLAFHLKGKLTPDKAFSGTADWDGIRIEDWLPENLADEMSASIQGHAAIQIRDWKYAQGTYSGEVHLQDASLRYTPFQSILGRFFDDKELLDLPLTTGDFSWSWNDGRIAITNIDLRAGGHLGFEGSVQVSKDKGLSGLLWVGIEPKYLESMGGLGDGLFSRKRNGMCWSPVKISGTVKKPEQDFVQHVVEQIHKHPTSVFRLGAKLVSWYIGNLDGADKEWTRSQADQN